MMRFLLVLLFACLLSCNQQPDQEVQLYLYGKIYTCDDQFSILEAMAVSQGKIIETGFNAELIKKYPNAQRVDLKNKIVYPGLFDAHCHFYALGRLESQINVAGSESWQDVLLKVKEYAKTRSSQEWIVGRGWDQTRFKSGLMPNNAALDSLFPNQPVLLRRVDGHAAVANAKALELAGITKETQIEGGEIEVKNGKLTGIIIDNAVDQLRLAIPKETHAQIATYLLKAQELCLAAGLTSVTDAGLSPDVLDIIDSLYKEKQLTIRINAMISANYEGLEFAKKNGPINQERFRVQSFKIYGDGALGSRGALLKKPYCDRTNHRGMLLTPIDSIVKYCTWAQKNNFQICTHAIGDSANRLLLDIYGKYTAGKDLRWRIEHAQVVDTADIKLFDKYSIIPSVQPTHATSDMRWANNRLCEERMSGAYAYVDLLHAFGKIALGTDFPIEDYKPNKTFYSAVFRQDENGFPKEGFQTNNALTKQQALLGMTAWAAYAQFDEDRLGVIGSGYQADFVISTFDWFDCDKKQVYDWSPWQVVIKGQILLDKGC